MIQLPQLFKSLMKSSRVQKQFLKHTIVSDVERSKLNNDNTLSERDYKKITGYYGFAVPALLGEGFCMLRGRSMSTKERYAITYLGALTGLFDDFFDEREISEQHILELINHPDKKNARNSNEKLFVKFYQTGLDHVEDIAQVNRIALKVFGAQILSRKQKLVTTEPDEIKHITMEKGGLSLLFYRGVFEDEIHESEQKMLYYLGGIGQLENDIFDIYKDYQNGIRTLATLTPRIRDLRQTYTELMDETFKLVHQTRFTKRNKKKFARFISLIICRGFVCLDFLEKNENLTNNEFSLHQYDKKDLICDMGKASNTIKLFNYYAKTKID